MSYTYKKMSLDKTSYNMKYKFGEERTPTEITYHQTANSAPAINERNYLNTRQDNEYISFNIVVDEYEAIECIPLEYGTWNAGDGETGAGNLKSISVEIARSTHEDLSTRNAAIENGALLIANLMKNHDIPMSKVYSHNQRSGKNCPHDIRGRYGEEKFRKLIQTKYDELTKPTSNEMYRVRKSWADTTSQKGAYKNLENAKNECNKHAGYSVFDSNGKSIYTNNPKPTTPTFKSFKVKIICDTLNVREKADFNSKIVTTVNKNEVFTIVGESNGLYQLKSGAGWISANSKYVKKI